MYDNLYRVASETNQLNLTRTYAWDPVGNLTKLTDRNGRVREFVYDGLDRRTQEKWLEGTTVVNTIDYAWDAADQLSSVSDAKSAYSFTYDALGRTKTVDNAGTAGVPNVVLTAMYDAAGNRTGLDATVGGTADFSNRYTYDALNRMARITQADGAPTAGYAIGEKRVDLAYQADGQYEAITRYADLAGTQLVATSTYGYDGIGRLASLSHQQGTSDLASYTWQYDLASRLTKVTNPDGTTTYNYDTTDQLTGADHSYQTDEGYSYDLNGNRTNTGYQTDTNNRLVSDGTYNYTYDSEGNRTRKRTIATGEYVEYTWDHRNRLTAVTYKDSAGTATKAVEYDYDVFDRRIAKRVDDSADGSFDRTYRYVYDGEDIVLVYDGTGSLENRYLHGPGIDEVFADEDALGEILWALTDNQRTVRDWAERDVATGTTSVVNHVTYDAFGEITGQTSATHEPLYAYTGREWDADAGMYYYRARWYDAGVGRFASEDPIGFEAGDPNLSRYVLNSPTNFVDPSGQEIWSRAIGDTGYYHVYDSDGFVFTVSYPRTGRNWDMLRDLAFATAQRIEAAGRTARIGAIMVDALTKGPELGFRCAFDVLDNVMSAAEFAQDPTLRNALGMAPFVPGVLRRGRKAVNLPSWRKVKIDMDHISSGHMVGGGRVSENKDLFPEYMNRAEVEQTVRNAYRNAERLRTQGDRVLVRGQCGNVLVEMWVNTATRTIETAYPVW